MSSVFKNADILSIPCSTSGITGVRAIIGTPTSFKRLKFSFIPSFGSPGLGRRLTRPEHYEQLKGQKCAAHLIRPDEQGRRDYAGILQGLDADGNVTLTDGEETYAFPVKSAGYVKLCDDEDLFG